MPKFGPLADPNFGMPSGNILLDTDTKGTDGAARWVIVDERGEDKQTLAVVKADGLHLSPISGNWGIERDDDGYPVVIRD